MVKFRVFNQNRKKKQHKIETAKITYFVKRFNMPPDREFKNKFYAFLQLQTLLYITRITSQGFVNSDAFRATQKKRLNEFEPKRKLSRFFFIS